MRTDRAQFATASVCECHSTAEPFDLVTLVAWLPRGGAPRDRVTRCLFRDDVGVSMRVYLALGDSISIDDYTGVHGGGAVSQLAHRLGTELVDLTRDGNTTHGVLADLARAPAAADVVTLTAGGNDLLAGELPRAILRRLDQIAQRIQPLGARVVINTVYDPSDGDNDLGPVSSAFPG